MEIRDLPDCLDAAVPFYLDIDIGVLCFKGFFHFVKWLEQAASRDHFEYWFSAACSPAIHPAILQSRTIRQKDTNIQMKRGALISF